MLFDVLPQVLESRMGDPLGVRTVDLHKAVARELFLVQVYERCLRHHMGSKVQAVLGAPERLPEQVLLAKIQRR
jgi:hypothetical protein